MPETAELTDTEPLYRTILVPTDGSRGARRGIRHGLDLARRYDATVHLLYVVDEHTQGSTPALSSDELVLEKIEERARRELDDVVAEAEELDVEVVADCVRGVPHDSINRYANSADADLIVMGVHGGERGSRPHVGSTTDRVLREARVPVLPV